MPRIVFIVIAAVVVVIAATVGRMMTSGGEHSNQQQALKFELGGPFTLTDQTGKRVTDKDFRGKYMLVYFGYTFCPDVCPTSLSIIGDALDKLSPEQQAKIIPIFISIDPERDTPEVLASYVPNFHKDFVGLTGTDAEIKAVASKYKAYYAKVNGDDPGGNYTMDHSSFTYLMGPDGSYINVFNHGVDSEAMALKLKEIIKD